jgi:endoglucanase
MNRMHMQTAWFPIAALLLLAGCGTIRNAKTEGPAEPSWKLWVDGSARATLRIEAGKPRVDIGSTGSRPWSIQLIRPGLPFAKGKTYHVVFTATSNPPLRLDISAAMVRSPGYMYSGPRYFELDSAPTERGFDFTMMQDSDPEGSIQLYLGCIGTGTIAVEELSVTCKGDAPPPVVPTDFVRPAGASMRRGIQFGLQLAGPFEGAYGPELREEYFDLIEADGRFDGIRLPVWWEHHTQKKPPYAIDPEFLDRVDWAVSNSLHRGFFTVLDVHWFRALEKEPAANKAEYLAVWGQIARRFKDYPDYLYFDILNEPNGKLDAFWDRYAAECYDLIRETNPTRTIIISSTFWANLNRLPSLKLPARILHDPNVMIQFHPYLPSDFCFQGSPGNGSEDKRDIRWLGSPAEKKTIADALDAAVIWAAKHGDPRLFAGEFCAQEAPPSLRGSTREDRLRWVRFIREECEKRDIPWNYYDFCEVGSRVYDIETGQWDEDLMAALFD